MRYLGHILSLICLFALLSCEVRMPDYVISPQKMETFLYDYHLIQSMTNQYSSDDYREKLYYSYVFKKHNIEKAQFDSSMQWYNRYPKHLRRIYESLEARLGNEVDRLDAAKKLLVEGVSLEGASLAKDSVDLWTSSGLKIISSTPLHNRLAFSFDAPDDSSFVKNDSLSFSFRALFVPKEYKALEQSAYASVRVDYADGDVVTNAVRVDSTGFYNLSVSRNPNSKLKSMSGFVYYTDNDTTAESLLLLGGISLVRMHAPKAKQ